MNILDLNLIANVHSDLDLIKDDNLIQLVDTKNNVDVDSFKYKSKHSSVTELLNRLDGFKKEHFRAKHEAKKAYSTFSNYFSDYPLRLCTLTDTAEDRRMDYQNSLASLHLDHQYSKENKRIDAIYNAQRQSIIDEIKSLNFSPAPMQIEMQMNNLDFN